MSDADIESETRFDNMDTSECPLVKHKLPMTRSQRRPSRRKNRFKRKAKLAQCLMTTAIFLTVLSVTATLIYAVKTTTKYDHIPQPNKSIDRDTTILLWSNNPIWGISSKNPTQQDLRNIPLSCGIPNCFIDIYSDHEDMKIHDATVVIPSDNIFDVLRPDNWSKQFLVYANMDQLMNTTKNIDPILTKFYMTFTYRTDSDLVWNRFEVIMKNGTRIAPAQNPPWKELNFSRQMSYNDKNELVKSVMNRTNFAIIRVCDNTSVNALVYDELKNYIMSPTVIDVDYNCQESNPYEISSIKNYKFLLAFEDALCTDNISKLFYTALQNRVIPVVLGGPINYDNFAPPYSYIVGQKFASIRELAEYLIHLDENPMDYVEYLWWIKLYTVQLAPPPLCELCKKLEDHQSLSYTRRRNVRLEWFNRYTCDETTNLLSN